MDILSQINDLFDELPESPKEEKVEVKESIDLKKADMGEVIKDFRQSSAPQFKGKSKKKKQEMAVAAKLQAEEPKQQKEEYTTYHERLMGTVTHQISKNLGKNSTQGIPELNEERIQSLRTCFCEQLFHEHNGFWLGGDGQTPGSGVVRFFDLDDVTDDQLLLDSIIWDETVGQTVTVLLKVMTQCSDYRPTNHDVGGATRYYEV